MLWEKTEPLPEQSSALTELKYYIGATLVISLFYGIVAEVIGLFCLHQIFSFWPAFLFFVIAIFTSLSIGKAAKDEDDLLEESPFSSKDYSKVLLN